MTEIIYATGNPGKLSEVQRFADSYKYRIIGEAPRGDETAPTLEENAIWKAQEVAQRFPNKMVIADDAGLEIDGLGGEPGIKVRRWKDGSTRMNDQEIIDYCLTRMKQLQPGERGAQLRAA